MTQPLAPRVLVVEDDDVTREALMLGLGEDAIVTGAVDVNQAARFAAIQPPDVIVLDLALDPNRPGAVNGPDLLTRLRSKGIPVPPVIVVSAGVNTRPSGMSSSPMTAMSSGTCSPCACNAPMMATA